MHFQRFLVGFSVSSKQIPARNCPFCCQAAFQGFWGKQLRVRLRELLSSFFPWRNSENRNSPRHPSVWDSTWPFEFWKTHWNSKMKASSGSCFWKSRIVLIEADFEWSCWSTSSILAEFPVPRPRRSHSKWTLLFLDEACKEDRSVLHHSFLLGVPFCILALLVLLEPKEILLFEIPHKEFPFACFFAFLCLFVSWFSLLLPRKPTPKFEKCLWTIQFPFLFGFHLSILPFWTASCHFHFLVLHFREQILWNGCFLPLFFGD